MKNNYIFYAAVVFLVALGIGNAYFLERRLRDGGNFSRRLKSCNLFCALRGSIREGADNGANRTELCYVLPSQNNETVTECAYRCLRFLKGEQLSNATECVCRNAICINNSRPNRLNAETRVTLESSTSNQPLERPATTIPTESSPADEQTAAESDENDIEDDIVEVARFFLTA